MNKLNNINEEFVIFRHLPLCPFTHKSNRSISSSRIYQLWFLQYLWVFWAILYFSSLTTFKCLNHLFLLYTSTHISETRSCELIQQISLFRDCPKPLNSNNTLSTEVMPFLAGPAADLIQWSKRSIWKPTHLGCNLDRAMNSTQVAFARYQW